jgi:hypothetical protein
MEWRNGVILNEAKPGVNAKLSGFKTCQRGAIIVKGATVAASPPEQIN